jgi:hypothetical protein
MHAAHIFAIKILGQGTGSLANSMTQNLRPRLSPPFNNTAFRPAAVFVYPVLTTVLALTDFKSTAEQMKLKYKKVSSDTALLSKSIAFGELAAAELGKWASNQTSGMPLGSPVLSSVGIIDGLLSAKPVGLTIGSPWLSTDDLSIDSVVHCWTWRGEMHLNIGYNAACFSGETMEEFLTVLVSELSKGLELELKHLLVL